MIFAKQAAQKTKPAEVPKKSNPASAHANSIKNLTFGNIRSVVKTAEKAACNSKLQPISDDNSGGLLDFQ